MSGTESSGWHPLFSALWRPEKNLPSHLGRPFCAPFALEPAGGSEALDANVTPRAALAGARVLDFIIMKDWSSNVHKAVSVMGIFNGFRIRSGYQLKTLLRTTIRIMVRIPQFLCGCSLTADVHSMTNRAQCR